MKIIVFAFIFTIIASLKVAFSQDAFTLYRIEVDSNQIKKYFSQIEQLSNLDENYIALPPSLYDMVFCDINKDGFVDVFLNESVMGSAFSTFFSGIGNDSLGASSGINGSIISIDYGSLNSMPEIKSMFQACMENAIKKYYHYTSFNDTKGLVFKADTIIEYIDDYNSSELLSGLQKRTLKADTAQFIFSLRTGEFFTPIETREFYSGQEVFVAIDYKQKAVNGFVPVFIVIESDNDILPDGVHTWHAIYGWIKVSDLK